jgi:hypothetical protein
MRKEEVHVLLLPLRRKGRILYPCSLWERNASQEYFASLKASRGRRMLVSVLKTLLFNNHVLRRLLGFKNICIAGHVTQTSVVSSKRLTPSTWKVGGCMSLFHV